MIQVPSPVVANEQTCRVTIFSEAQQNEVKFAHALQRFGVGARSFACPEFRGYDVHPSRGNRNVVEPGIAGHA